MDTEQELRAIVIKKLTPGAKIEMNTKLAEAGLDSLDVVEIAFDVEDRFRIQLPPLAGQITDVPFWTCIGLSRKNSPPKPLRRPDAAAARALRSGAVHLRYRSFT